MGKLTLDILTELLESCHTDEQVLNALQPYLADEQPAKQPVEPKCSHEAMIDTGVGYYHCPTCDYSEKYPTKPEPFTNEMESMLTIQCLRMLDSEQRERLASKIAPHPTKPEPSRLEVAQDKRERFWMDVWIAVASSSNVTGKDIPTLWANYALEGYDELIKQSRL